MDNENYRVGEKVRIREDLKVGERYGDSNYSNSNDVYRGMEATIVNSNYNSYRGGYYELDIDDGECYWTDGMLKPIERRYTDTNKINKKKDGGSKMFNVDSLLGKVGKIEDGSVVLTLEGEIAVKRSEGEYVRYNKTNKTIENKMDMVLKETSDFIYIFPTDKVVIDDVILYKDTYCQIIDVKNNGELIAINIKDGSKKTMVKEINILGLNLYYKVVSLFSQNINKPTTDITQNGIDQNMLMMMLGKDDNSDMLPLMLMQNINKPNGELNNINPMMLMLMSKNKGEKSSSMKDLLIMQMLSGQNNNQSFNPMVLMAMSDGDIDMKTLMLMNMFNNNAINTEQ